MADFYIGYQKAAPAELARRTRRTVILVIAGGIALAGMLAALQAPFDKAEFEFGNVQEVEGVVRAHPYPALEDDAGVTHSLVGEGKHGAAIEELDGRRVRLAGTRIYRDDQNMLEVVGGSPSPLSEQAVPGASVQDLGEVTLVGEIVDSKCYLGVMKPGRGKPHRACASLCIRGGVPPVFLVETAEGERRFLLLVDEEGGTVNDRVLDRVAEPLEITGRLSRKGERLVLAADPAGYRRVEGEG